MASLTFSEAWGNFAISVLVSAVLSGGVIMQAGSYFSRFQKDPLVLKSAVGVIWLCSSLRIVFNFWVLHSCIILGYNLSFDDVVIPPGFSISVVLEIIVHATTQGTYIFRMYRFAKNPYVLAPGCILVLVELGLGFTWAGRIAINGPVFLIDTRDQGIEWDITTFFILSAFIDVFITTSMSYQLFQSRGSGLKRTKHLVDRIIRWTLPTGMLTSSVAIAVVLTWNIKRESFLWAGIFFWAPECYAIGLLTLLNARRAASTTIDSNPLSFPLTTLTASSIHMGVSSSSIAAATASGDHGLGAPSHKVIQIVEMAKPRDGTMSSKSGPSFTS